MVELSVVVPVFNEVENLAPLIGELENVLRPLGGTFEIILVDDGSTDESPAVIERFAKEKSWIRGIFFRRNAGQAAAFDAGFRAVAGKIVVTLDADLQNDPRDLPRMIEMVREEFDFVTGWRKNRQDSFLVRTLPSRVANGIIRWVTGTKIHDLGCSLKVYRREIVDNIHLYGEMHRFISVIVEGIGARVGEIEAHHRPRVRGVSKYGMTRTFKVVLDLLTIWFLRQYQTKPIYVFGGLGVSMIGAGFLSAAFVLYQKFFESVWVHKNPMFVLSVMFTVIGIQFLGLGILAELIIRTYFESQKKTAYIVARTVN